MAWIHALAEALCPLQPTYLHSYDPEISDGSPEDFADADAVLQLPDYPAGSPLPEINLQGNSSAYLDRGKACLHLISARKRETHSKHVENSKLGGTPGLSIQTLEIAAFLLAREGLQVAVERPGPMEEDRDYPPPTLKVELADPSVNSLPEIARYPVVVRTDLPESGLAMVEALQAAGFRAILGQPLSGGEVVETAITLREGPLSDEGMAETLKSLRFIITTTCTSLGIDMQRYPVQTDHAMGRLDAILFLPTKACLAGTARSTGGDHPDRFRVTIETDEPSHPVVLELGRQLQAKGFRPPLVVDAHSAMDIEPGPDRTLIRSVFRLVNGALRHQPASRQIMVDLLEAARGRLGADASMPLRDENLWPEYDADVHIELPVRGVAGGELTARLKKPDLYFVKLVCSDLSAWTELEATLAEAGFNLLENSSDGSESPPVLIHGAAPEEVMALVSHHVRAAVGKTPRIRRKFHDGDREIYIHLPTKPMKRKAVPRPKLSDRTAVPVVRRDRPFLDADMAGVTVAGIRLERRNRGAHDCMVPPASHFSHFCVDQSAAPTLLHLALSVRLGEPCLLEGETSTAKTSSIQYLASLVGQPVARINLNGQTDTGELIGRFVPATGSRTADAAQWAWQDGILLEALRHGWWVILDEVNLAEPAILERLNSLLERSPSLLVTEHNNHVFGPGGEPIHGDFRIFATMNPAEYSGRNTLSPAYRDRWRGHLIVQGAGEGDYRAMLRQMVLGERPRVCLDGMLYGNPTQGEATHGELADQEGIGDFIDALARFQASLDAACRRGIQGGQSLSGRKERPVFTRRGLIAILDHLASPAHAGRGMSVQTLRQEAVQRYFLARFDGEEEVSVVQQLLQASGLRILTGGAA